MFEFFGYASAILFFVGYLPQLWRTYRLKTVEDISVHMWILTCAAYLCGFAYGMHLGKLPLIISYGLGLYCTIMMLIMYVMYRDPNKAAARKIIQEVLKDAKKRFKK